MIRIVGRERMRVKMTGLKRCGRLRYSPDFFYDGKAANVAVCKSPNSLVGVLCYRSGGL